MTAGDEAMVLPCDRRSTVSHARNEVTECVQDARRRRSLPCSELFSERRVGSCDCDGPWSRRLHPESRIAILTNEWKRFQPSSVITHSPSVAYAFHHAGICPDRDRP